MISYLNHTDSFIHYLTLLNITTNTTNNEHVSNLGGTLFTRLWENITLYYYIDIIF